MKNVRAIGTAARAARGSDLGATRALARGADARRAATPSRASQLPNSACKAKVRGTRERTRYRHHHTSSSTRRPWSRTRSSCDTGEGASDWDHRCREKKTGKGTHGEAAATGASNRGGASAGGLWLGRGGAAIRSGGVNAEPSGGGGEGGEGDVQTCCWGWGGVGEFGVAWRRKGSLRVE